MSNNIFFDIVSTQPIGANKRHGGGKYGEIVFHRMLERNVPMACFYDSQKWLNPDTLAAIQKHNIPLFDIKDKGFDEVVKNSGCDVIYSALPKHFLFHYTGCKVVCTVHGLRTLETPADHYCFYYKNSGWRELIMFLAKKLTPGFYKDYIRKVKLKEWSNQMLQFVTVSNHSSNSIKVFFPELKDKDIPVFYSPSTSLNKIFLRKYSDKYFMMVSGNRYEKNNLRAIQAIDKLFTDGYLNGYKVKITGLDSGDIFRYKIKNIDKFDFLGFVDEDELAQLYYDAYALIYPSLNEGFGYPPLEAMRFGVPVLASSFASISEVCEGAALYFNPFSVEEIAVRILYIVRSDVRKAYSERAISQYKKITAKQNADLDALIDYIVAQ